MMPMTPSGTRICPTWMPVGRYFMFEISPIGSASAAICVKPSTMVAIAASDRVRRSSMAGARPAAAAASRSRWLASRSRPASRTMAAAIRLRARLRVALSARAMAREAVRARVPTSCIYSVISMLLSIKLPPGDLQAQLQHGVPGVARVPLGAQALDHLVDLRRFLQRRIEHGQRNAPQCRLHHALARSPDAVLFQQGAQWTPLRHARLQF